MGNVMSGRFKTVQGSYTVDSVASEISEVLEKMRSANRIRKESKQIARSSPRKLCVLMSRCFFEDLIMYSYDGEAANIISIKVRDEDFYYIIDWSNNKDMKITRDESPPSALKMDYDALKELLFLNSDVYPHMTCYILYKLWKLGNLGMEICVERLNRHMITAFLRTCTRSTFEHLDLQTFITVLTHFILQKQMISIIMMLEPITPCYLLLILILKRMVLIFT